MLEYIRQTPNNGLIRYSGMFGFPRVLVTESQGQREVLYEKSYSFHKSEIAKRITGPLLGGGVLIAEGDLHKVFLRKGPTNCLNTNRFTISAGPKEETWTSICTATY